METMIKKLEVLKLATVNRVIMPVLGNVVFDMDYAFTYDGDTAIRVPFKSGIRSTAPIDRLLKTAKANKKKGDPSFIADDSNIIILYRDGKTTLKALPFDDMPDLNFHHHDKQVILELDTVKAIIKKVTPFSAHYETNGVLGSVNVSDGRWCATDGSRLGVMKAPTPIEGSYNIPVGVMVTLGKLLDKLKIQGTVRFSFSDLNVTIEAGDCMITSRLIDGQYPKYMQLIPENPPIEFSADTKPMLEAIDSIKHMANDRTNVIKFQHKDYGIDLIAETVDVGSASSYAPTDRIVEIGQYAFNYKYIQDALKAIDADAVTFKTSGPLSPFTLSTGNGYIHLIMPVQIQVQSRQVA